MKIYSRRWGHKDTYYMKRNNKGWKFCFQHDNGQCDPTGQPFLFKTLDHDSINYPEGLGGYMGYLWREAREKNMSVSEIQEKLDVLANWISTTEKASPRNDDFFSYYK